MLSVLLAPILLSQAGFTPTNWFGPATVAFDIPVTGNPYDPVANDVRVRFRPGKGGEESRLAYFDGKRWKATFLSRSPGVFTATVTRNGVPVKVPAQKVSLSKVMKGDGFVRLAGKNGFKFDSGKRYWPLGTNVAWSGGPVSDIPSELRTLGKSGVNWSRIWANHWDNKNPYWTSSGPKPKIGYMEPTVFDKWDKIVAAANESGIRFQMTMFHHGPYSIRVNSNWGEHPWNVKNGGFLNNPTEFFTSPRAKALAKGWLRYAVARYGQEPSIMAWELFNEVEWCDPNYDKKEELVGAWHDEMADYIRSIDPYKHLVTTSSELHLPIWRKADFYQPHGYPASISAMVLGLKVPTDKPLFYGEFGSADWVANSDFQSKALRDGVYSSLIAGHSGAAQYWSWEYVASLKLYNQFAIARKVIDSSKILEAGDRRQFVPVLDAGQGGDLEFAPGLGWAKTTAFEFNLPADAQTKMGGLSSYIQGTGHRDMMAEPIRFRFEAKKPARFELKVAGTSSGQDSKLTVKLNGEVKEDLAFPPGSKPKPITLDVPAGTHVVEISNEGPDWVQVTGFKVTGIADRATALGTGNKTIAFVRAQLAGGVDAPANLALRSLPLTAGKVKATVTNLATGASKTWQATVKGGTLMGGFAPIGTDMGIVIQRI